MFRNRTSHLTSNVQYVILDCLLDFHPKNVENEFVWRFLNKHLDLDECLLWLKDASVLPYPI